MCLFLKTIGQKNKAVTFYKAEKSKYIAAYLHSHFPYVVGIDKLCEILRRHGIELSYQFQNPQYFFGLGVGKRVEELFDRRNTSNRFVKVYSSHAANVNILVNLAKIFDQLPQIQKVGNLS